MGELAECGPSRPFELRVPNLDEAPSVPSVMARVWLWLLEKSSRVVAKQVSRVGKAASFVCGVALTGSWLCRLPTSSQTTQFQLCSTV